MERAVYQDGSVISRLVKSLQRTIELQLLITLHHSVNVNYSKSI